MDDLISRQAAIDALVKLTNCNGVRELFEYVQEHHLSDMWSGGIVDAIDAVIGVPSVQPGLDEWCTGCKEYDQEKHCCPRWNRVIREALKDAQPEERTNERTETHACDSISRQAAIDAVRHAWAKGLEPTQFLEELPSAQPEPKWIPCSERLPEPRMDVWTCSDIGQIQGYYEEHVGIWYASFGQGRDYLELYVTAWMPLPEPYQAERREK